MISTIWKRIKHVVLEFMAGPVRPSGEIEKLVTRYCCECKECHHKFPPPVLGMCPMCGSGYIKFNEIKKGVRKNGKR